MLTDEVKHTIQTAYRKVLNDKQLRPRMGQRQMIAEIANTLSQSDQRGDDERVATPPFCVVEAGTGTGKTLAYILAVLPIAKALGKKVVLSTATVALQEQLVYKDLPDIQSFSGLDFSFAIAKGRGRYICLSKLDRLLMAAEPQNANLSLYPDEVQPQLDEQRLSIYQSMMDSLSGSQWDGDRDKWEAAIEDETWSAVTTDRSQCGNRHCSNFYQCSFFKAREDIQKVDCLVTNHDLVLSDMALGGGAILTDPAETIYVFDEGHHLADRAINHFSHHTRLLGAQRWLEQLNKSVSKMSAQLASLGQLSHSIGKIPAVVDELHALLTRVVPLVQSLSEEYAPTANQKRYIDANPIARFPHGRVPDTLREYASEAVKLYDRLIEPISRLHDELSDALEEEQPIVPKEEIEAWYAAVGQLLSRAEANYTLWFNFAMVDPEGQLPLVRWISTVTTGEFTDFELWSSPILAANQLQNHLWSRCFAVVVTSATLTALGRFDRFITHTGVPKTARCKVVPSPFNYQEAATLSVPKLSCEPGDVEGHTNAIIDALPDLIDVDQGTLVLFASRRQLWDVYEGMSTELRDITLKQGDYSKMETLRRHRVAIDDGAGSILFGLASFAEGVDLPGNYCTHVIIAKIPFAVPDRPVEAALSEWIEDKGGNSFMEMSVPDAAVRLLQASGRLLRTETDTGRITLLDRRIVTKRYGKAILDSLPPYKYEVA